MDSTLLTREEAAALLVAHPQTIKKWAREGRFPEYKVGGSVRYRRDELLASLKPVTGTGSGA